jgi:hypothetical protein
MTQLTRRDFLKTARFHEVIARFPFYDGYPNSNRPVQPLNRWVIRLRRGGGGGEDGS